MTIDPMERPDIHQVLSALDSWNSIKSIPLSAGALALKKYQ
jgi:hypothetical protein